MAGIDFLLGELVPAANFDIIVLWLIELGSAANDELFARSQALDSSAVLSGNDANLLAVTLFVLGATGDSRLAEFPLERLTTYYRERSENMQARVLELFFRRANLRDPGTPDLTWTRSFKFLEWSGSIPYTVRLKEME